MESRTWDDAEEDGLDMRAMDGSMMGNYYESDTRFPCGCRPCPDCGAASCSLGRGGCGNEVHDMVVNGR